jgi:antitoxin component YwqK of YwqJK toxin-antitoxin module
MRFVLIALILLLAQAAQAQEILAQERWPDGTLKATRYAEGGRIHFITYHENGRVRQVGCFLNGRRDGLWREYSDTGVLLTKAGFRNGERQGVWEFRSHGDAVMGRLTYTEGRISTGEQYDEAGTLVAVRTY